MLRVTSKFELVRASLDEKNLGRNKDFRRKKALLAQRSGGKSEKSAALPAQKSDEEHKSAVLRFLVF